MLGLRSFAPAIEPVVQRLIARPGAPAPVGRVVLDVAHGLDAAGDDDVGRAGLHHHRRRDDRLQAAAAAAVELQARHLDRAGPRAAPPSGRCTAPRSWRRTARRRRLRCAPGRCRCAARVAFDDRGARGPRRARRAGCRRRCRPRCAPGATIAARLIRRPRQRSADGSSRSVRRPSGQPDDRLQFQRVQEAHATSPQSPPAAAAANCLGRRS